MVYIIYSCLSVGFGNSVKLCTSALDHGCSAPRRVRMRQAPGQRLPSGTPLSSCALAGWESLTNCRITGFRKEETSPDPLLKLRASPLDCRAMCSQLHRDRVPFHVVPRFHQQCRGHTAILAAPSRLPSLVRALP